MPQSMTGFGKAMRDSAGLRLTCEIRSVNGRFLKTQLRLPTGLQSLEPRLEALVGRRLRRGSVTLSLDALNLERGAALPIDETAVRRYQAEFRRLGLDEAALPTMPGVLLRGEATGLSEEQERVAEAVVDAAVTDLLNMRGREGLALSKALREIVGRLREGLAGLSARAPAVVLEQRDRLKKRVDELLAGSGVSLDEATLAREVALLADKSDVAEELARLSSHLDQVDGLLSGDGEVGRTLDFLVQELHREVSTIGHKSGDVGLAQLVVALKADIERLREQVANLE